MNPGTEKEKQTEGNLNSSEEKYRQLIENSLQGIVIIQDYRLVYVNKAFSRICGYSIDELTSFRSEEMMRLIHPDDRKKVLNNLNRRLAGEDISPHYNFKGITKDGKVRILDIYANRIEYESKYAIQGIILDITEQVDVQENLRIRTNFVETILNNLPLGIAVNEIDSGKSTFINKEFQEISGWTKEDLPNIKKFFKQAINDPDLGSNFSNKYRVDIKDKKPENLFWDSIEIESKNGEKKYLSTKTIPLYDQNLTILTIQDVTEQIKGETQLQNSLKEKEILLREIHHRVKNNLQTISSLLDLQAESINDLKVREIFKSSQSRVRSMALIHERLYKSEDLSRIKAREYITSIVDYLEATYDSHPSNISLEMNVEDIFLNLDIAIPCGLIINELVSNSMKYAFPDISNGKVMVSLELTNNNQLELSVKDDGVGIPDNITFENSPSLGLQLVDFLAKQINGKIKISRRNGTQVKISFPIPAGLEIVDKLNE